MLCKRRLFALAAALGVLTALTGAHAQPPLAGRTLRLDNTAFISVDYDYRGSYGYRNGHYGDGLLGLFQIPGAVIGGVFDLLSGAPGDQYYGGPYYSRPLYVSPYYGSPYRGAYYGGSYYDSPYSDSSYSTGPRYGGRGYYGEYRNYDDRKQFSSRGYGGWGYYDDQRIYDDRRQFSGRGYSGWAYDDDHRNYDDRRQYNTRGYDGDRGSFDDRQYGNAYYPTGYNDYPRYSDRYNRSPAPYDADDDDD